MPKECITIKGKVSIWYGIDYGFRWQNRGALYIEAFVTNSRFVEPIYIEAFDKEWKWYIISYGFRRVT